MSTENNPNTEYYSVSSGSKRRKLSNDQNGTKLAFTGGSADSLPKVSSSAVEDPESISTTTSGDLADTKKAESNGTEEKVMETGSNNSTGQANEPAEKKSLPTSTKPVFGAASAFGSASIFEKMKNRVNVFDSPAFDENVVDEKAEKGADNQAPTSATSQSPNSVPAESSTSSSSFGNFGSSFGANSIFSNALQKASQKKSFLDEPEAEAKSSESSSSQTTQQYKQVDLKETVVTTGEENEKSVFNANTKLFELDFSKLSEGWKERGVGPLHLNKAISGKAKARLVMRSKGLLRVILNYAISPDTVFIKGLEASLSPGKFLRMNSIVAGQPVQYLLKFGSEELRNELFDKLEELKSELKAKAETAEAESPKGVKSSDGAKSSKGAESSKRLETSKGPSTKEASSKEDSPKKSQ